MVGVSLRHVYKKFGELAVVDDVNLEVADEEFLVLLGPSGCGKTTTMRIIAGLETATSGDVYIGGRRVNDLLPRHRDVAMVFQSYALYPHMTVFENLGYPLKIRKVPAEEMRKQVIDAARRVNIEELLDRLPKQLSGGQRQRVALGRALIRRPNLFLMDEPLSNLDAKLRVQMRGELKHLQHALKTTTIYVTHDQIEAMTLATRVAVMNKGVMQQLAPPKEIYDNPANLFVAGFIGSPSMNFLKGDVASGVFAGKARAHHGPQIARCQGCDAGRAAGGSVGVQRAGRSDRWRGLFLGADGRFLAVDPAGRRHAPHGAGGQGFLGGHRRQGVAQGQSGPLLPVRYAHRGADCVTLRRC